MRVAQSGNPGDYWRRGTDAMNVMNWELAIECFTKCVNYAPENSVYRQTVRGCTRKLHNEDRRNAAKVSAGQLEMLKRQIEQAKQEQDWDEVDRLAEEGLVLNPWDCELNLAVAEAADERGFFGVKEVAIKFAFEADTLNKEIAVMMANVLYQNDRLTDAIKVWEHIAKIDPKDPRPQEMIIKISSEME